MPYSIPSRDEYKGSDFGTLSEDEYILRIERWEERDNNSKYASPGDKSIWFFLSPVAFADDPEAELVDENNEPVNPEKTLIFFYDPKRLGLVPVISKNRKFLAAALNVPIEERIEFESYDDLVGKEIIGMVTRTPEGQNRIAEVRPIRKKNRQRVAAKAPLVEKAEEIFETSSSEDDELPF